MVDSTENPLAMFQPDAGDDADVKTQDLEELKLKSGEDIRGTFILKEHLKAMIHDYRYPEEMDKFPFRYYCKSGEGANCCTKSGPAYPYWCNFFFAYKMEPSGKPIFPISGRVLFTRFKKNKYIAIRNCLTTVRLDKCEDPEDTSIGINDFDITVSLDGDEQWQKLNYTHSTNSILLIWCANEVGVLIAKDKIKDDLITDELIKTSKDWNDKDRPANLLPKFSRELINRHSPTMIDILKEVDKLSKYLPTYTRLARNLTVEEINNIDAYALNRAGTTSDTPNIKPDPEAQQINKDEIDNILGV